MSEGSTSSVAAGGERAPCGRGSLARAARERAELLRALAVAVEPPTDRHATIFEALGLGPPPEASEFADVFLFQLYPYASVHMGEEGMLGGVVARHVAGAWRAMGRTPPAEPDHLAGLLVLYASSLDPTLEPDDEAGRALMRACGAALLCEHLAPWAFFYLARVEGLGVAPYARWAALATRVLRDEVEHLETGSLQTIPEALAGVAPLADPRAAGGGAFLDGLLAPARTGFVVTRADLARVARSLDCGLRAGERRYALEHLLEQNAPGVLRALAGLAREEERAHTERVGWLGAAARFYGERAGAAASLLEELASEADRSAAAELAEAGAEAGEPGAEAGSRAVAPEASRADHGAPAAASSG